MEKVNELKEVEHKKEKPIIIRDKIKEAHELLYGIGRARNPKKAIQIYIEEENKQNPIAYNALGKIYLEGKDVPKDIQKAYGYFNQSHDADSLY